MKDKGIVAGTFAAILFVCLFSCAIPGGKTTAKAAENDHHATNLALVGTVKNPQGVPITNAWIFVDAARPRKGPGFL